MLHLSTWNRSREIQHSKFRGQVTVRRVGKVDTFFGRMRHIAMLISKSLNFNWFSASSLRVRFLH